MIEALPSIGVFIATFTFGAVIYSFGYVHGAADEASGKIKQAEARLETFFARRGS